MTAQNSSSRPPPRTALITGASAGLGVEFANQLAARNYNLVLVARRKEKLEEVAEELANRHGVSAQTFSADLSEPSAPKTLFSKISAAGIHIDYLVNNAGSAGPSLLEGDDWERQAKFLELMMTSVTHMCHHFIPPMQARGFGRVLNVASFAGRLARSAGGHYGPSKAYVIALTEELDLMLKGSGVQASVLCPGFTHTDFHETAGMMEMKNSLPSFMWYDAEVVVREGIEALEKNQPIKVSGRLYRWIDPLAQSVWVRSLIKAATPGR